MQHWPHKATARRKHWFQQTSPANLHYPKYDHSSPPDHSKARTPPSGHSCLHHSAHTTACRCKRLLFSPLPPTPTTCTCTFTHPWNPHHTSTCELILPSSSSTRCQHYCNIYRGGSPTYNKVHSPLSSTCSHHRPGARKPTSNAQRNTHGAPQTPPSSSPPSTHNTTDLLEQPLC